MKEYLVTILRNPICSKCDFTERMFRSAGINFDEKLIPELNDSELQEIREKGYMQAPVVVVDIWDQYEEDPIHLEWSDLQVNKIKDTIKLIKGE